MKDDVDGFCLILHKLSWKISYEHKLPPHTHPPTPNPNPNPNINLGLI